MHLDGEYVMRGDELEQQRGTVETRGQLSQGLLRKLLQHLTDAPPFERSVGNGALMVISVAEDPRFADRTAARPRVDTDRWVRTAVGTTVCHSWWFALLSSIVSRPSSPVIGPAS